VPKNRNTPVQVFARIENLPITAASPHAVIPRRMSLPSPDTSEMEARNPLKHVARILDIYTPKGPKTATSAAPPSAATSIHPFRANTSFAPPRLCLSRFEATQLETMPHSYTGTPFGDSSFSSFFVYCLIV